MTALQPVHEAPVDHHDLVFSGMHDAVAIHRDDLPGNAGGWRARNIAAQLARWLGNQPVAHAHFFLGSHDIDGGRNDVGLRLAVLVGALVGAFAAHQFHLADIVGFVAQDLLGGRVFERRGVAKHAEIKRLALGVAERLARAIAHIGTACIGAVAPTEKHPPFLGGHDARGLRESQFINNQRLGQERLDVLGCQRRNRGIGQRLVAGAR